MKQPKCPWCGMGFRGDQSDSWHVEGFREEGRCGSQWFPDFEGGHTEGRKQSEACREIARLKIAHLRRMADTAAAWAILSASEPGVQNLDAYALTPKKLYRLHRFHAACLTKITELKEPQCSTKS